LEEAFAHYVLSILAVALLCSMPSAILGLPASFSGKFLLIVVPISLFVGAFDATASLAKSAGRVPARLARLTIAYCFMLAGVLLLGSAVAFYIPLFRAMLVWQMLAALTASTAAVMTWRFFEGIAAKSSRAVLG